MHKLTADFLRFDEADVFRTLATVGIYVIWAADAKLIPTYIGHGHLLSRLSDHAGNFRMPLDGYLAVIGDVGDPAAKNDACIVEGILLWIAEQTERIPKFNKQRARTDKLEDHFPLHGVVKAIFSGYDPFVSPRAPSLISEHKRHVRVRPAGNMLKIEHGWHRRRRANQFS